MGARETGCPASNHAPADSGRPPTQQAEDVKKGGGRQLEWQDDRFQQVYETWKAGDITEPGGDLVVRGRLAHAV